MSETGSSSRAVELDHIQEEIEEVSAVPEVKEEKKSRNPLRKGSEGEEVRAMQEASQKLDFTWVRKTWSFPASQVGPNVLSRLGNYSEPLHRLKHSNSSNGCVGYVVWEDTNGAAVTSGTEISEVQQTLVKEGVTKVEVSKHRVFLLGENRWKDSSGLSRNQKNVGESKTVNTTTRCVTCRREGRLLCADVVKIWDEVLDNEATPIEYAEKLDNLHTKYCPK
ncbi:unnamed protein product [Prunus armeniaca]